MKRSMADVRAANKAAGKHWFDRATMKHWRSRIETPLYASGCFVTSESEGDGKRRYYTVRRAMPDGSIKNVGEFMQWGILEYAIGVAKEAGRVQTQD